MIQKPLLWTGLIVTTMLAAITVMVLALRTVPPPENKAEDPCAACGCAHKSPEPPAPIHAVMTTLADIIERQRQSAEATGKLQERLAVAERRQAALATGLHKSVEDFARADKE